NPARPSFYVLGVYDPYLLEPVAHVLQGLGARHALVIHGMDKMDEISMSAPTAVCELKDGAISTYEICPEDFGFTRCRKEDVVGGTAQENAQTVIDTLSGAEGPKTDIVLLNAGAAIYAGGRAASIAEGVEIARQTVKSGAALRQLEAYRTQSNS
ncbi:MAG: anthranilate phosphoribosyltransferase, partial [Mailhella sp.]|nr:anthranilate phosphoribosyltransferase [Mailhella sp.]